MEGCTPRGPSPPVSPPRPEGAPGDEKGAPAGTPRQCGSVGVGAGGLRQCVTPLEAALRRLAFAKAQQSLAPPGSERERSTRTCWLYRVERLVVMALEAFPSSATCVCGGWGCGRSFWSAAPGDERQERAPLRDAARAGDLEATTQLVRSEADGSAAMRAAAANNHVHLLKALAADYSLDAPDEEGCTPLMAAAMNGAGKALRLLLGLGADWRQVNATGSTAMELATLHRQAEAAALLQAWLCQHGTGEEVLRLRTEELRAAAAAGEAQQVRALLSLGAAPDGADSDLCTALRLSAEYNRLEVVEILASAGASVDGAAGCEDTPLMAAAADGHTQVASALLRLGADWRAANDDGQTAFALAKDHGQTETARLLETWALAHGSEAEGRALRCSLLRDAAKGGEASEVARWVAEGADIDDVDEDWRSALSLAAWGNHAEAVQLLVDARADLEKATRCALPCPLQLLCLRTRLGESEHGVRALQTWRDAADDGRRLGRHRSPRGAAGRRRSGVDARLRGAHRDEPRPGVRQRLPASIQLALARREGS